MDTTIGLKDIHIALITEDSSGYESYGTPEKLAPAMTVQMDVEYDEAKLPADDRIEDYIKLFKQGKLKIGASSIPSAKAAKLTGATVDSKGCLIDCDDDEAPYYAVGFKSLTSKGKYRYVWLYRTKFSVPSESYETKGDGIKFNSPAIEGVFVPRNKPDTRGKHPWRTSVTDGETSADATTISNWFSAVPEPSYSNGGGGGQT